jgi:hypothetical protein
VNSSCECAYMFRAKRRWAGQRPCRPDTTRTSPVPTTKHLGRRTRPSRKRRAGAASGSVIGPAHGRPVAGARRANVTAESQTPFYWGAALSVETPIARGNPEESRQRAAIPRGIALCIPRHRGVFRKGQRVWSAARAHQPHDELRTQTSLELSAIWEIFRSRAFELED